MPRRSLSDETMEPTNGFAPRRTLGQMLDWCAIENDREGTCKLGWWWFVMPTDNGNEISRMEGWRADQARLAAEGKPVVPFKPEPGETEWIHRATAEYLERYPNYGKNHDEHLAHFKQTMARWTAMTPWRVSADAA